MIREPVVAGAFYEGSPDGLDEHVGKLFTGTEDVKAGGGSPVVVSPHAGYVYSGRTAARAIASLREAETFIVLGPNHTGLGPEFSLTGSGSFSPLPFCFTRQPETGPSAIFLCIIPAYAYYWLFGLVVPFISPVFRHRAFWIFFQKSRVFLVRHRILTHIEALDLDRMSIMLGIHAQWKFTSGNAHQHVSAARGCYLLGCRWILIDSYFVFGILELFRRFFLNRY